MNKNPWVRGGCIALAILMAAALLVEAKDIGKVNTVPPLVHKIEHFVFYGVMAALWAYGLGTRFAWWAVGIVALVGALDEWHQFYVPGRSSSAYDWMVDLAGAAVAVYVFSRWQARRGLAAAR